jgi:hypothetical protein
MRERDLDEFASLFQRSIIPTIEVASIEIRNIVVLADFDPRSRAGGAIAAELARRFGARVSVRFLLHPDDEAHAEEARGILDSLPGDERRLVQGDPVTHVHEITGREKPSLIVAPAPFCPWRVPRGDRGVHQHTARLHGDPHPARAGRNLRPPIRPNPRPDSRGQA